MNTQSIETTTTDATVGAQSPDVTPAKAAAKKIASSKKSAPKAVKGAKSKPASKGKKEAPAKAAKSAKAPKTPKAEKGKDGVREGSKTSAIIFLLQRKGGAALAEIMEATAWQAHSVRGFLSTLSKKPGLTVISAKGEDGVRSYSLKS